jgi:hypothetical protein
MRKYVFVFGAILAYLLFCAKSCESPEGGETESQEVELAKIKDSIKSEFESDDLTKKTLRAFEVKAQEKLVDFSDYLNLYVDHSMDDTLKNQIRQMISELFVSEDVTIKMNLSPEANEKGLNLNELLMTDFARAYDSVVFRVDSIGVLKPLRPQDEFSYFGILEFKQTVKSYSSSGNIFTNSRKASIEIQALKVEKSFGSDTLQIWKVFLGNME